MDDNVIEVKGLKKKFGDFEAVSGVDFEVRKGEIFGFLGPNGAGKTTTINMLCTMTRPTEGDASICGHDIFREKGKVRESIGIIFQENTLDEKLTAHENLMLHCRFYSVPRDEREKRVSEVLRMVELDDKRNEVVENYSGGMKRRLEIARGLLHYPRVLFLDEPTVGLDPQTRTHIWDYILELKNREGITIFLTTHYMDEAEYSDRIAIMDHGKIIALDTPDNLKKKVGGDIIELVTEDNERARGEIVSKYGKEVKEKGTTLSFNVNNGSEFLASFIKDLDVEVRNINLHRPTLNDVFLSLTGREIRDEVSNGKKKPKFGPHH
ncbi:MAG TPA: ATP-binding cassette domain-containing protein [Candidatus Methanofastidiosa archaeon]|nr:ATP-binding cassette domain-containing protein [Candidatus Methanofastidiosa archaeon]HPR41379.1 ATP-binding cassette domain-containing protein [Candidatus Methanofastidiosa archaeon]